MNKTNVLMILADDMNYNSVGCFGCPVDDITPNLDRLAAEGVCFHNAHVSIAVCQPSRECLLTGVYPHRNGAPGFMPIADSVPTLTEVLREEGYYNGIIGKVEHCMPVERFAWDYCYEMLNPQNLYGRAPYIYGVRTAEFLAQAKQSGKPFFLMANSHDPHRPFAGSEDEVKKFYGYNTYASRVYKPEEAWVPGFLPDLPDVRKELAQYYSSVHRCDETIGAVLNELEKAGMADNTLVIYMSDNGMAFPFAKANCYLNSTKTPLIARWPGHIQAGSCDREHSVTGVDFTPTVLEALGLAGRMACDGMSYLPLLEGRPQPERENIVFTEFNLTSAFNAFPMRCVQTKQFGYIYNIWPDGQKAYKNESQSGLTFKAMEQAAQTDDAVAARVEFFTHRCPEEFYDFSKDPDALHNLIDDPAYQTEIQWFRDRLKKFMEDTQDPELPEYRTVAYDERIRQYGEAALEAFRRKKPFQRG